MLYFYLTPTTTSSIKCLNPASANKLGINWHKTQNNDHGPALSGQLYAKNFLQPALINCSRKRILTDDLYNINQIF